MRNLWILTFIFLIHYSAAQIVTCDRILDQRDGQVYPTVMIGQTCWMAKNLNYGEVVEDNGQITNGRAEKSCYQNKDINCERFGGLYIWQEAVNDSLCPAGWSLPSKDDWLELSAALGSDSGQKLKASGSFEVSWDGNNQSGFTALPAGNGYQGRFGRMGDHAYFWSSSEKDENFAWFAHLDGHWDLYKYTELYIGDIYVKENAFSIRCIKK